eukprot:7385255-Pyramimonas_sp.AAC.1
MPVLLVHVRWGVHGVAFGLGWRPCSLLLRVRGVGTPWPAAFIQLDVVEDHVLGKPVRLPPAVHVDNDYAWSSVHLSVFENGYAGILTFRDHRVQVVQRSMDLMVLNSTQAHEYTAHDPMDIGETMGTNRLHVT